jgi:hypothetical protein
MRGVDAGAGAQRSAAEALVGGLLAASSREIAAAAGTVVAPRVIPPSFHAGARSRGAQPPRAGPGLAGQLLQASSNAVVEGRVAFYTATRGHSTLARLLCGDATFWRARGALCIVTASCFIYWGPASSSRPHRSAQCAVRSHRADCAQVSTFEHIDLLFPHCAEQLLDGRSSCLATRSVAPDCRIGHELTPIQQAVALQLCAPWTGIGARPA